MIGIFVLVGAIIFNSIQAENKLEAALRQGVMDRGWNYQKAEGGAYDVTIRYQPYVISDMRYAICSPPRSAA